MGKQFEGKKLLVIGGTSGIGLQTARTILAEGGHAVIVGSRPDKTEAARAELAALGQVSALTPTSAMPQAWPPCSTPWKRTTPTSTCW